MSGVPRLGASGWLLVVRMACWRVALPLLTVLAPWPLRDGQPLLARYLGQADLSRQIIAAARGAAEVQFLGHGDELAQWPQLDHRFVSRINRP